MCSWITTGDKGSYGFSCDVGFTGSAEVGGETRRVYPIVEHEEAKGLTWSDDRGFGQRDLCAVECVEDRREVCSELAVQDDGVGGP